MIGSGIGALAGVLAQITIESYRRRRDRQVTAAALSGSIRAIIRRTEEYDYAGIGQERLSLLGAGKPVSMKGVLLPGAAADPIWERHYDKVGLLGPELSGDVIDFYSAVSALRQDITRLYEGELDSNPDKMASLLRHGLAQWATVRTNGLLLIERLRAAR